MSVSLKNFQMYGVYISDEVKDSNGSCYYAWIVLAWFNPLRYINYLHFLEGDKTPLMMPEVN